MQERLPDRPMPAFRWIRSAASLDRPDSTFDGIAWRRTVAFLFDMMILLAIFVSLWIVNIMFLGGLTALLTFLWPALLFVVYDTALVGGQGSATIGMRLMGLRTVTHEWGEPGYLQAFVLSVLFYLSITFTSGLILLVALFNNRGRCVHDMVAGIFLVNNGISSTKAE